MPLFEFKGDARIQNVQRQLEQEPVFEHQIIDNAVKMNEALQEERKQEARAEGYQTRNYNALILSAFPPLQREAAGDGAPALGENLSYKERKKQKKENAEAYKKLGKSQKLLDYKEVQNLPQFKTKEGREKWAGTKPGRSKLTRRETMEMMGRGDYSNFENLDDVMRSMFAKEALKRLIAKYTDKDKSIFEYPVEQICKEFQKDGDVGGLLDPALRLGLSLGQKEINGFAPEHREWFQKLDEQMSAAVMLETLKQKNEDELKVKIANEFVNKQKMSTKNAIKSAEDMVEADKAQKIQVAKRLMLMHMGQFSQVNNKKGEESPWNKPVAVALSHCSRVTLALPRCPVEKDRQEAYKEMWNSIFYQRGEEDKFNSNLAQDNRRAASTHNIEVRRNAIKEKKVLVNLAGQRGMNVAIGGLGNQGISGKMLLNNGSCGHFYSMYKEGDTENFGAILMGLESDRPGVTNQLGHTHDARATAEKASSLGGQRTDEVGIKYGGRRCNLTYLAPEQITYCMDLLEKAMRQNAPGMDGIMELLVGSPAPGIIDLIIDDLETRTKQGRN